MIGRTFDQAPQRVYWELTRACDLACRHCRAEAMPCRAPDELSTDECQRVLRQLAQAEGPGLHLVFTGGDPLKRADLFDLIHSAVGLGLHVSVAPSATLGLTREVVHGFKSAGVAAMSLSFDGPTPAHHDAVRGVLGCFGWTLAAAQRIVAAGIPLQINTLVTAETEPHLDETAKLVGRLRAARWSLFFLIPVGRGRTLRPLSPADAETTLHWLSHYAPSWPFVVSTTEAPHYRRIVLQQKRHAHTNGHETTPSTASRSFGIRDGNGIMFIAANGDITPSGFLPLTAGNVRQDDPLRVYREAPLFVDLRDPGAFHGRCGACTFRSVCGGSRARAWAATGDVLGEDPLCAWEPAALVS